MLRRGKKIETLPAAGATEESLARLMVGREVLLRVEKGASTPAEPLLEIDDLHVTDDRGIEKVRGLSLEVRGGEIVGLAGVDGNGQTELIDAIAGLQKHGFRSGPRRRRGRHERERQALPRRGARAHPGGPAAPRARARLLAGREPRAARLRLAAGLAVRLALPEAARGAGAEAARAVRRPRRRPADAGGRALRRQPAEGRAGARDRPEPERADRGAADARPRRRRDRVRPPPPRRGARRRVAPSCSSRSSWTRSSRSPTGSSSSTRARSWASSRRASPRRSSASR